MRRGEFGAGGGGVVVAVARRGGGRDSTARKIDNSVFLYNRACTRCAIISDDRDG